MSVLDEDAVLWWEAYQLAERGEDGELGRRAAAGDGHARQHLAGWLADRGRTGEAVQVIRPLADAGDEVAGRWLARWLAELGEAGELRRRAAAGSYPALVELARWLAGRGDLTELRDLAAGHRAELAGWLSDQHDPVMLALAADLGDDEARLRLAQWRDRLRERAAAGSEAARQTLADWPA